MCYYYNLLFIILRSKSMLLTRLSASKDELGCLLSEAPLFEIQLNWALDIAESHLTVLTWHQIVKYCTVNLHTGPMSLLHPKLHLQHRLSLILLTLPAAQATREPAQLFFRYPIILSPTPLWTNQLRRVYLSLFSLCASHARLILLWHTWVTRHLLCNDPRATG